MVELEGEGSKKSINRERMKNRDRDIRKSWWRKNK